MLNRERGGEEKYCLWEEKVGACGAEWTQRENILTKLLGEELELGAKSKSHQLQQRLGVRARSVSHTTQLG